MKYVATLPRLRKQNLSRIQESEDNMSKETLRASRTGQA